MIELFHYTQKGLVAPILTHGLFPSARFHDLGLEMRRNVIYCWLTPEDDRMGYRENPDYVCLKAQVEPDRCLVADMDLATLAYQHLRGVGGKERDPEKARAFAEQYQATAVPVSQYRPRIFAAPEVLVKGAVPADRLSLAAAPDLPLSQGELVRITARRADGTPYRWWEARVEKVTPNCVVTYAPAGCVVHHPGAADWQSTGAVRTFYWTDRPYNLNEIYQRDRETSGLYVHIASPAQFVAGGISYHDYELDVNQHVGQAAQVLDEDEFAEAACKYGYSPEFQAECRAAVQEALRLVDTWIWPYRIGSR